MKLQRGMTRTGKPGWPALLASAALLALATTPASAQAPAKHDLEALLKMGQERQPALAAARASLAGAVSGQRGLDSLPFFAKVMARDLSVRKEQSAFGITIAHAGLRQAEWETRYAVIRNFYSVQYARIQDELLENLVGKLERAKKRAKELVDLGDPKYKVTQLDVDMLAVNLEFVRAKKAESSVGIHKACAALREALGVEVDCPLKLVTSPLALQVGKLSKDEMIAQALANRGEMEQASAALRLAELEIDAQKRVCFNPVVKTFAAGADVHAKQIPQGRSNGEYLPEAIGPEAPANLVGKRRDRLQRAQDLSDRATAVVNKTHNLISLEVEAFYLKWQEASIKAQTLEKTIKMAESIAERVQKTFNDGGASGEELLRSRTLEDQARAMHNEALYLHALALAGLERATAGGYRFPVPGRK